MQFRKVGRRIQILESVYDPAAKRCRQRMIGSLPAYWLPKEVPADLELDEAQRAEVAAWLAERHAADAADRTACTVRYAPDRIREIALVVAEAESADLSRIGEAIKVLAKAVAKRKRALGKVTKMAA